MEKIVKRLFITGVVLTAAAVSSLSLTTYAVDYACPTGSTAATCQTKPASQENSFTKQSIFTLTVGSVLELSNVVGAHIPDASISSVNTDTLSATVTTNYKTYVIQLSAEQTDLVLQGDATKKIPASSTVTGGTSSWGIMSKVDNQYHAITTTPTTFFSSNAAAPTGTPTAFTVGIGVSPVQTPGTYGTEVTVTAIAPAPAS